MFKNPIKTGTEFRLEKTVTQQDTATAYGSGGVDVFATPAMIALMENTALQIDKYLKPEFKTVGIEICVKHIKATPVGRKVYCIAKITNIDGAKITFDVEAFDQDGKIGFGTHKRYIVNLRKFLQSLT